MCKNLKSATIQFMNTYILANAKYYKCLTTACPEPCCHGWTIQVEPDNYEIIKREKGFHGFVLRHLIKGKKDKSIRQVFGRCPFLVDHGLCRFQRDGRTDLLPLVCSQFPFQVLDLGDRQEVTMLLSCPATAAVFNDHPDESILIPTDEKFTSYYVTDNNDEQFLHKLLDERDTIIAAINDAGHTLPELFAAIYASAAAQNARYLSNTERDSAFLVHLSFNPDDWGEYAVSENVTNAFFPIELIDEILLNLVDYSFLITRNRRLYLLIRKYKRIFGNLYQEKAAGWFDNKLNELYDKDPSYATRHRSYFAYTIQQLYPLAYDTYFWQRQVLLSILYTELLEIFDVTEYISETKVPTREDRILTLSAFERGTRHNPTMTENIFNLIRKRFL